ncbi:MAG: AMP-binding protein, partial [Woeseia sp.]
MNNFWKSRFGPNCDAAGLAVQAGEQSLSDGDLKYRAEKLANDLVRLGARRVGLYADNGIDWIVTDLACQKAQLVLVPLPLFFSSNQLRHVLDSSGIDTLIADRAVDAFLAGAEPTVGNKATDALTARIYRPGVISVPELPAGTQKITFTSGTTGTAKGVCLSADQQFRVADALTTATGLRNPKHLCCLPLSTLLENIAGIYAPLLAGGTLIVPPLSLVGLDGSSNFDVATWLAAITRYQPNSIIIVPEMLNAMVLAARAGWPVPQSLKFVAVGGGKVSADLLRQAGEAGIPAFEGYGLSECASVVTLNTPGSCRVGSVGRPLPHVTVKSVDDEIVVSGSSFLGYLERPDSWGAQTVRTGDKGFIDNDGFVHVDGRLKNQLITSFGRNLSPEWVESELLAGPLLQQAVIIGDDHPYCVALVFPRQQSVSDQ